MLSDVVLEAARRLSEAGRVPLPALQADPEVAAMVRSEARLLDVMAELERRRMVRLVVRHPVRKWEVCMQ